MKNTSSRVIFYILALSLVIALLTAASAAGLNGKIYPNRPKLILTIVIDQFRADYLTRFKSRFQPGRSKTGELGGFSYLMREGAYYPFAEYSVFQNMTGPGHSMILSGTLPYQSGIPINTWFDTASGKPKYCVEDNTAPIVGALAELPGMSPRNFTGTTIGDEIKNAGFDSRAVTVSLKDRAAILLGGKRADLALWMDKAALHWVSSRYYIKTGGLPSWVRQMNKKLDAMKGKFYVWKASGAPSHLSLPTSEVFKHSAMIGTTEALNYPFGEQVTTDMAIEAAHQMKLGSHAGPDILAVSYSSHDAIGHTNGPNTLELEEMTVAEDREISRLLNFVAHSVPGGMKNVIVVFTADHGIPPSAPWLKSNRVDAGFLSAEEVSNRIGKKLDEKFGPAENEPRVSFTEDLNFYFNRKLLANQKTELAIVESIAKEEALTVPGIAQVVTSSDYEKRNLPPGLLGRQILNSYVPGRSGDLVIIPKPFYMVDKDPVGHHTGYTYDRTVPLVIMGANVRPGVYAQHADIIDVAPTLAFFLGIIPPSLSEGRVLSEIVRN